MVFAEAMLHGLPCVGTTVQSIPAILGDGQAGLLVPPSDPRALAEALLSLLRDPARAQRLGAAGRALALREHTWSRVAQRMAPQLRAAAERTST
jgi:phenylacetate-CoA ligase